MRPRFLLLAGGGPEALASLAEDLGRSTGLSLVHLEPPIALLTDNCTWMPVARAGLVIGKLFPRHGPASPLSRIEASAAGNILSEGGSEALLRGFWGSYVAALPGRNSVRVLRDPSGGMPCYFVRQADLVAFASDAPLLVETGLIAPAVDWSAIARLLFDAGVPVPGTCVSGIEELLPGFATEVPSAGEPQAACWSPWDHVHSKATGEEAADRVGRAVRQSVRGLAAPHRRLLASVSGGLDSSIVAACLAETGQAHVCLTMFGVDPSGDERPWARSLCDRLGLQLVERQDLLGRIDIEAPLAPHLPRPFGRTQALSYESAHIEVAKEEGADGFVTGNGGDSVFGYSQSAAAIADRYIIEGLGAGVFASLLDVVRQTGCSAWQAAAHALRIARAPHAYRCKPDPLFLHKDALEVLGGCVSIHPWLEAPPGALPGKAAHIASIVRVQHCMEPGRATLLPVLNPLVAQPVMETCLAIPSWEWRTGGRDRAVARRAFANHLPVAVVRRRVKGGPEGFAAQLLEAFRPQIRERLAFGQLASNGILDGKRVGALLAGQGFVSDPERVRLLQLLAAEAWLDVWNGSAARARGGNSR